MTAKEYLSQAYRLDQRINSNIEEVTMLREMASSISSPSWGEKVQTSRSTEAPFVRSLEKIMDLEDTINKEIDTLVCLKRHRGHRRCARRRHARSEHRSARGA